MERETVAYLLIAAMLLAAAFAALHRRHHSRTRTNARRRVKDEQAHQRVMADKERG